MIASNLRAMLAAQFLRRNISGAMFAAQFVQ
jgi:hypothetical protein